MYLYLPSCKNLAVLCPAITTLRGFQVNLYRHGFCGSVSGAINPPVNDSNDVISAPVVFILSITCMALI